MDFYSQQRVVQADGSSEAKTIDPRLEAIVDRMFQRCLDDGQFKQAIGIAIETRRMDIFKRAILESVSRHQLYLKTLLTCLNC